MSFELIISILAFLVSFLTYRSYAPKLIFKVLDNSYLLNAEDFPLPLYKNGRYVVFSCKISNSSAHPITIDEVSAKLRNLERKTNPHTFIEKTIFELPVESGIWASYQTKPSAELPLRIQPYDTVYYSFCFLAADNLKKPYKILFTTPRKTYRLSVAPSAVSTPVPPPRPKP